MSGRLPSLSGKDVIKVLKRAGFEERRTTGSHVILRHKASHHKKDHSCSSSWWKRHKKGVAFWDHTASRFDVG